MAFAAWEEGGSRVGERGKGWQNGGAAFSSGVMKRLFVLVWVLLSGVWAFGETVAPGRGLFEFQQAGKTVPVWYFLPTPVKPDLPVLFVMHGVKRDAERYREDWIPHAEKAGFVLVVPEFSRAEFPKDADYSLGSVLDGEGPKDPFKEEVRTRAFDQRAFSFIEPIFDAMRQRIGNVTETYQLYGHSAGAQFAHRFLYFVPGARVSQVVAANAGWWTLPDPKVAFPYGLNGSPGVGEAVLKGVLQRRLIVLLGTADTDPKDANLNRSEGAMAQGAHRFERGKHFFEQGQIRAIALDVPLGWKLGPAPGVGHRDSGMAPFAMEWLFGEKAEKR